MQASRGETGGYFNKGWQITVGITSERAPKIKPPVIQEDYDGGGTSNKDCYFKIFALLSTFEDFDPAFGTVRTPQFKINQ